jgi:Flp pilus assembly pilin Flp
MLKFVQNFVREEDGLEMVEWAIVAAVVTSVAAGTLTTIGGSLNASFTSLLASVQAG